MLSEEVVSRASPSEKKLEGSGDPYIHVWWPWNAIIQQLDFARMRYAIAQCKFDFDTRTISLTTGIHKQYTRSIVTHESWVKSPNVCVRVTRPFQFFFSGGLACETTEEG